MKLLIRKCIWRAAAVVFCSTVLLWAQSEREKIAVIEIKADMSASKVAALTEKVTDEIFKMDLFLVCEQSRVNEVMIEQGLQQSGCAKKECAVRIGQILGVQKVIFGRVKKESLQYKISLKMADIQTGNIVRRSSMDVQGSFTKVLSTGILKATRGLIGSSFTREKRSKGQKKEYSKKSNVKTVFAILCAATGTGFGGACAYYWSEKKKYSDRYASALTQPLKDKYEQEEKDAATVAGIFTGTSVALLTTSVVLFIMKPGSTERKNVSVDTRISPDVCAVTVNVSF